ncbi:hypothetical protein ACGFW5_08995 [Streptomyces sp. NPDC048416]|uniref:hypothetical protein n=1 Tax=Streptomyces sp. NPDC048416 TaxID=3365546 RepID=UPI00371D2459
MGDKPDTGTEDKKRIDLSVPQVAGSALAAVSAAVLASRLGVYGTFLGAGVVSVVATCGGTVFQHVFKRTGEQLREVTVQAKSGARQVPVVSPYKGAARESPAPARTDAERTRLLTTLDETRAPWPADETAVLRQVDETAMLRQVDETAMLRQAGSDRTRLLKTLDESRVPDAGPAKEFNEATVHGTRLRGWKRPLLAAAVVFGVSMGGITAYELASGSEVGGHGNGTTLQSVFTGGAEKREQPANPAPSDGDDGHRPTPGTGGSATPTPTPSTDGSGTGGAGSTTANPSPSPDPSRSTGAGSDSGSGPGSASGGTTPHPTPTPSGATGSGVTGSGSGSGSLPGGPGTPDTKSGGTPAP